jgi:heterotetrameric sarcosine oxidase gamma subunit
VPEPPARRSALAEIYRPGTSGAERPDGPGVTLAERVGVSLVHLAGRNARAEFLPGAKDALGVALPVEPNRSAQGPEVVLFPLAPGRWLVESSSIAPADLEQSLRSAVADAGGAVADVSSAWTILRLAGPDARRTLAKGCPIDLHPSVFPRGSFAQTSLEGTAVLLHALPAGDAIDLYLPRSFGRHTCEWLLHAAAEFGAKVDHSTTPSAPLPPR